LDEQVLIDQSFKSAYSTLLYILARKMEAVDWLNPDIFVGDPTDWHFHHIFPQENFNGDRSKLKDELEVVQQKGSDDDVLSVRYKMQLLALQVNNIANLAFLIPESNIKIGSRRPSDYLEEICSLPGGEDNLRKQLIPLDRNLWTHKAYSKFCAERRRLIVQAAKDLLGL